MIADVICYWKLTSLVASDGVYYSKTFQINVNLCNVVYVFAGVLQCNGRKLEEAEYFKCIFVVYCDRIEIDQLLCLNC